MSESENEEVLERGIVGEASVGGEGTTSDGGGVVIIFIGAVLVTRPAWRLRLRGECSCNCNCDCDCD